MCFLLLSCMQSNLCCKHASFFCVAELCTCLAVVPAVIQTDVQIQIPPYLKLSEFNQPINPLHLLFSWLLICLLTPLLIVYSHLCWLFTRTFVDCLLAPLLIVYSHICWLFTRTFAGLWRFWRVVLPRTASLCWCRGTLSHNLTSNISPPPLQLCNSTWSRPFHKVRINMCVCLSCNLPTCLYGIYIYSIFIEPYVCTLCCPSYSHCLSITFLPIHWSLCVVTYTIALTGYVPLRIGPQCCTFHCVVAPTHHNVALQLLMLLALSYMVGAHGLRLLCSGMHDIVG